MKEEGVVRLRIAWKSGQVTATLKDTPTTRNLKAVLPFEATANRWGKEIYFEAPLHADLEADAEQVVEPGTVCFWVEGSSLAIPFGPTPVSRGYECRLVTRVNVLGSVEGDASILESVRDGTSIRVEKP
ncbi:MAG: cyclophilin-like fold protein [Candidatus Binatia bacterium]